MTAQPGPGLPAGALRLPPLPNPPRKSDMQEYLHFDLPAVANTMARHLDALRPDATTFVAGRGYLCRQRSDLPSCPYPDMLVSYGVIVADLRDTNGYVISEAGKPPDLVMEVASSHTARRDYIEKRGIYAGLGVTEYWRFDHTGGRQYDAALAGDRLAGGVYSPVEMFTESGGVIWGYSEALGLSLCWVDRQLRFWDRANQRYLPNPSELEEALRQSQAERAAAQAERAAAEERIRHLEDQLRRLQNG